MVREDVKYLPNFPSNPLLTTFVRITLIVAAVLIALSVLHFVLGIVVFAAIAAAVAIGILFVVNLFRGRRLRLPVSRG